MSNQPKPTLMGSIQSAVPAEASPFLKFIIRHARKFALLLGAIVLIIIAYVLWDMYATSQREKARATLGVILLKQDSAARLSELEKFQPEAPKALKAAVALAIMQSAMENKNYARAETAWAEVSKNNEGPMSFVAKLGEANALALAGQESEALIRLEAILPLAPQEAGHIINSQIVTLAESLERYDRAILACQDIINNRSITGDASLWIQRMEYLRQKMQDAGAAK